MNYLKLKAKLAELEAEVHRIRQQDFYQNVWLGACRPAGTARGNVSTQYQLRSHSPIFNGKKSRYLKASEVSEAREAIARGWQIARLERKIAILQRDLDKIERAAAVHGLPLPKISNFEALTQSQTNEWYTQPIYIDLARQVLGDIDLDPASNARAQTWIQAKAFYTKDDDGFSKPWLGRMWLNPPYGKKKPKATDWMLRAIAEYDARRVTAAVLLVRGDSGGIKALQRRFPCCEPFDRIAFIDANGQAQTNPPPGYRFFYLGNEILTFKDVFSSIGVIVTPA
jgi:hypothetical protein